MNPQRRLASHLSVVVPFLASDRRVRVLSFSREYVGRIYQEVKQRTTEARS